MTKHTRPPLGLTPRFLVDESRLQSIMEAMDRRSQAGKAIPFEWIEEHAELMARVEARRSRK